jgi:hypothetical protein
MQLKLLVCLALFLSMAIGSFTWAQKSKAPAAAPSAPAQTGGSMNATGMQKPIEIRGQSRNLNMTLLLNNRTDAIQFVEPRKNYKKEIGSTVY